MKTPGILLFWGLLSLWTELPPACGQAPEYRLTCPPDYIHCVLPEPNECENNSDCKGWKICCQNRCAKRCVSPVKPGICPIDLCRCPGPQPDKCSSDFSCKGKKKCCQYCCAMRCMDPKQG